MTNDESLSTIEMHNAPESHGQMSIKPVGTQPRITYHVDWEQMGQPTPQMFHDASDAQVTLATMGTYIDDQQNPEVRETYDNAIEAVNSLMAAMAAARLEDDGAKMNLYMGDLEELPEVTREVEQAPVDGEGSE